MATKKRKPMKWAADSWVVLLDGRAEVQMPNTLRPDVDTQALIDAAERPFAARVRVTVEEIEG